MSDTEELPLVHESRPGTVASDAPAVVLLHGRGANERDLLPLVGPATVEQHHGGGVRGDAAGTALVNQR